ncbi:MAG: RNA polymerase sigma factor [Desertimonas sp.]
MQAHDIEVTSTVDTTFAEVYEREIDGLVRHAALVLGSAAEANDVVHDAFAGAYRRWSTLDEPRSYLYRSVINGCRDRWRRAGRERRALEQLASVGDQPAHDVLWDVMSELPLNERLAVVLRYYGGFSQAEIAAHMECPPGSIGPWIRRALDRMKEALDD